MSSPLTFPCNYRPMRPDSQRLDTLHGPFTFPPLRPPCPARVQPGHRHLACSHSSTTNTHSFHPHCFSPYPLCLRPPLFPFVVATKVTPLSAMKLPVHLPMYINLASRSLRYRGACCL